MRPSHDIVFRYDMPILYKVNFRIQVQVMDAKDFRYPVPLNSHTLGAWCVV
jgi:hypothetical protein